MSACSWCNGEGYGWVCQDGECNPDGCYVPCKHGCRPCPTPQRDPDHAVRMDVPKDWYYINREKEHLPW